MDSELLTTNPFSFYYLKNIDDIYEKEKKDIPDRDTLKMINTIIIYFYDGSGSTDFVELLKKARKITKEKSSIFCIDSLLKIYNDR